MSGTVTLRNPADFKVAGATCDGTTGVAAGGAVTVSTADGRHLADGRLGSGTAAGATCSFAFSIPAVPSVADSYQVTVSGAKPVAVSRAEAHGALTLTVGEEPPPPPSPTAPAGPAAVIGGGGTYEVGRDIQPGTYRGSVPEGGTCYWARLKSTDGTVGSIIANGLQDSGPVVVTIRPGDVAFEVRGCGTLTKS